MGPVGALLALAAVASLGVVLLRASATWMIASGLCFTVFAGHWDQLGLPIGLDRLLIAAGLFSLLLGVERRNRVLAVRFRSEHAVMLVLSAYATISALIAGTLFSEADGAFALLDRLSVTGFILFTVSPLVFHDRRSRNALLVCLVVLGAFLGYNGIVEGFGAKQLAFPRYIDNPDIGIHYERARGPILESAGFGLALFQCAVAAVVAERTWTKHWARLAAGLVAFSCLLGTLFTLTRAVWIGVGVGLLAVMIANRDWRRRLLPAVSVAVVVLIGILTFSSGIESQVEERSGNAGPIWDRINLVDASIRAVEEQPLFGIGWRRFRFDGAEYLRQLPDIPQQGAGLDVHNAVLSHAAELGMVGATLWLAVVAMTIGRAVVTRPRPELADWHAGLIAMAGQWAVVAMSTPFSYTFSFAIIWAWSGVVLGSRITRPRQPTERGLHHVGS
jgi:putative inorganic carbon (hco3(-)) transporter